MQVLDKVQLENLHALAPVGSSPVLALCRELAAPSRVPCVGSTAGAVAAVGTPPVRRRQVGIPWPLCRSAQDLPLKSLVSSVGIGVAASLRL